MSTEHKREKIKDIRIRPMHRHLFLYEKAVLLCKRKEDTQNNDRDVFSFKNMLRVGYVMVLVVYMSCDTLCDQPCTKINSDSYFTCSKNGEILIWY